MVKRFSQEKIQKVANPALGVLRFGECLLREGCRLAWAALAKNRDAVGRWAAVQE